MPESIFFLQRGFPAEEGHRDVSPKLPCPSTCDLGTNAIPGQLWGYRDPTLPLVMGLAENQDALLKQTTSPIIVTNPRIEEKGFHLGAKSLIYLDHTSSCHRRFQPS